MASPIKTIQHEESLDAVWEELVYSEARCLKDPNAKGFAKDFGKLIERCEEVRAGQRKAWRAEIVGQAGVDAADDELDDVVDELDAELLHILRGDRTSPRYKHYFSKPKNEIIRLGLESELGKVRTWPPSLKSEPEKPLQKLGGRLESDIAAGDEALTERLTAAQQRAVHRLKEIVTLIDDVNAARRSIYGALLTRGEELKLEPEWANRFFRRTARAPRAKPEQKPE
jgi:hypothetical protein